MHNSVSSVRTAGVDTVSARIPRPLQLAAAAILGLVVLYGVGLAQTPAVHNAAHDMRHSQGFPCH